MSFNKYALDDSYEIDGYFESEDEIIVFVTTCNEKQKEIPAFVDGKKVII